MEKRDSFIFYRSFFESIEDLAPEDQLAIYKAICAYALNGTLPQLKGSSCAIFKLIRPILDANFARFQNGKKGGRPKKDADTENPNETKPKPRRNPNATSSQPNKDDDKDANKDNHEKNNKDIFDEFRRAYPGTKRGLETEYENFQKKHTDWQRVIPLLMPALQALIKWREAKIEIHQFVPEFANLSTWINQRRWETELEPTEHPSSLGADEFIRDGKRFYGDPHGEHYPVPLNAPPRPSPFHAWSDTHNEWIMN
mgnify:FL=1